MFWLICIENITLQEGEVKKESKGGYLLTISSLKKIWKLFWDGILGERRMNPPFICVPSHESYVQSVL